MLSDIKNYIRDFNAHDPTEKINAIPPEESADFIISNAPRIEIPDKRIEKTYYYRLWTFSKHIKKTDEGFVITEFLPDVPWSSVHNAISCPVDHHVLEGRWLRDKKYVEDDLKFWCEGSGSKDGVFAYSNHIIESVYRYATTLGDISFAEKLYPALENIYIGLCERHETEHYGLFWSNDDRDGMEYSISGPGLRPTINSYMYASMVSLEKLCRILEKDDRADFFRERAEGLKNAINKYLWDEKSGFYKTVPLDSKDGDKPDFERKNGKHNVMEEIGFIPWTFGIPNHEKDTAWKYLTDEAHFAAPYGPTTADRSHPGFMKTETEHECIWDGYSWPYATSQTLCALENLLKSGRGGDNITRYDYMALLKTYEKCHHLSEDGVSVNWIDEVLDPFTGVWTARKILKEKENPLADRGACYNHSQFVNHVISGAMGISIEPVTDGDGRLSGKCLVIDPLCTSVWDYFKIENLLVSGKEIKIIFDKTGTHFGFGTGLTLIVDGKAVRGGENKITYYLN